MTRPSKREIETELADLDDTDDGTEIDRIERQIEDETRDIRREISRGLQR